MLGQAEHDQPPLEPLEETIEDGAQLRAYAGGSGAETDCYVASHPTPPSMVLANPAGQALARKLSKTRRVIFPASHGSGGSDPCGPYEPRRLAADIAALLDAASAQRTIVWAGGWADSSRSRSPVVIRSRYPGWCWTV